MKKKYFLLVFLIGVTTPVFFVHKNTIGKAITPPWQYTPKGLPNLPMLKTDGTKINARELKGKVVLILFQPDCDHCQREAVQIREHLNAFEEYTLYFISYAPMSEIRQFARDYQLSSNNNIYFAYADAQPVLNSFGQVPTPSIYIYSSQQQLVKAFKGETPLSEILPYM